MGVRRASNSQAERVFFSVIGATAIQFALLHCWVRSQRCKDILPSPQSRISWSSQETFNFAEGEKNYKKYHCQVTDKGIFLSRAFFRLVCVKSNFSLFFYSSLGGIEAPGASGLPPPTPGTVHFPKFNYCFSFPPFFTGNNFFTLHFCGDAIVSWLKGVFPFSVCCLRGGISCLGRAGCPWAWLHFILFLASSQRPWKKGGDKCTAAAAAIKWGFVSQICICGNAHGASNFP